MIQRPVTQRGGMGMTRPKPAPLPPGLPGGGKGYVQLPEGSYRQGDYEMGSVTTIGKIRYGIPVKRPPITRPIDGGFPIRPPFPGRPPFPLPGGFPITKPIGGFPVRPPITKPIVRPPIKPPFKPPVRPPITPPFPGPKLPGKPWPIRPPIGGAKVCPFCGGKMPSPMTQPIRHFS